MPSRARWAYDRRRMFRYAWVCLLVSASVARAGALVGKIELPAAPERPALVTRGFLDRVENPTAPVRGVDVTRQLIVVLEGDEKPVSPPQVTWELLGDSFARPVVAAAVGAEVIIKNVPKTSHTLMVKEDPKLIPAGPINPGGTKSFRVAEAGKTYTFGDKDAPYLHGTVITLDTQFIGYLDDSGRFEIGDVPPGNYKLKIYYADHWLDRADDVTIKAKGKTDFNLKLASLAAGAPKK